MSATHRGRVEGCLDGNSVPPPAAAAIASVMGHTLLLARAGVRFQLAAEPIWVRRLAWSMSVAASDEARP